MPGSAEFEIECPVCDGRLKFPIEGEISCGCTLNFIIVGGAEITRVVIRIPNLGKIWGCVG